MVAKFSNYGLVTQITLLHFQVKCSMRTKVRPPPRDMTLEAQVDDYNGFIVMLPVTQMRDPPPPWGTTPTPLPGKGRNPLLPGGKMDET